MATECAKVGRNSEWFSAPLKKFLEIYLAPSAGFCCAGGILRGKDSTINRTYLLL